VEPQLDDLSGQAGLSSSGSTRTTFSRVKPACEASQREDGVVTPAWGKVVPCRGDTTHLRNRRRGMSSRLAQHELPDLLWPSPGEAEDPLRLVVVVAHDDERCWR
jgi:hypothetical protein